MKYLSSYGKYLLTIVMLLAYSNSSACNVFVDSFEGTPTNTDDDCSESKIKIGDDNYIPVVPTGAINGQRVNHDTNPSYNHAGDSGVFIEGHNVTLSPFYMGETEVTYKLYKETYEWGLANGYKFTVAQDCVFNMLTYKYDCTDNPDKEPFAKGGNSGSYNEALHTELEPVTQISWRDAIIWANAYTEMTQGSDEECVYRKAHDDDTVLKSAVEEDLIGFVVDFAFPHLDKKGFRLPTEAEWEYAARYQGDDDTNAVQYGDIWLTKLWSMSGMVNKIAHSNMLTSETSNSSFIDELNNDTNRVAVINEIFDGTSWIQKNNPKTLEVKNKAPNSLGLYDMSGNVAEICFDAYSTEHLVGSVTDPQGPLPGTGVAVEQRVKRGGHFLSKSEDSLVGFRFGITPKYRGDFEGFRLVFRKENNDNPSNGSSTVKIEQPAVKKIDVDGYFFLHGKSYDPDRQKARKNHDYILLEVSKVNDPKNRPTVRYFLRNEFKENIWLRYGAGKYKAEVFELESVFADLYGEGDIRTFRKARHHDKDLNEDKHDHGHDDGEIEPPLYTFEINNSRNQDGMFLYNSQHVQSDSKIIRNKALEITKDENTTTEKVLAIHNFVLDTLQYDEASLRPGERKKQDAISVLESGFAVCEGYTFLTTALARSIGIKTKAMAGFAGNPGEGKGAHAWTEMFIDGQWKTVDPTINDDLGLRDAKDVILEKLPSTHELHPKNPERPDV